MALKPDPMPIRRMLEHIARELEMSSTVFSVSPGFRAGGPGEDLPFGQLELPLGVAPGPHTQTAQGLVSAYVAGARSFGLRTVGPGPHHLDPRRGAEEFIKGRFLMSLLGRELGLGQSAGAVFFMDLVGGPDWLAGGEMTAFFDAMADASVTSLWDQCLEEGRRAAGRFNNLDRGTLGRLSTRISNLCALGWKDPAELEGAAGYLLEARGLHTYIHLDPDADLDALGPVVDGLRRRGEALGLTVGLSLKVRGLGGVPGALELAARCARRWPGIPLAWAGGADVFNIRDLAALGFRPVSVDATLLGPGGYLRLRQLARALNGLEPPAAPDPDAILALAHTLAHTPRYGPHDAPPRRVRLPGRAPLMDCFTASCRAGCPFGQDIPGALRLMSDGRYRDALRVILDKNPLPHLTGALCPQPCQSHCTRLLCDEPVQVARAEALCAQMAWDDLLPRLEPEEHRIGQRVAVVGGSPGAMAAAVLFARRGVSVTLFAPDQTLCAQLCRDRPELEELVARDARLLEVMGADVRLAAPLQEPGTLLRSGYSHVVLALERGRWPHEESPGQLRLDRARRPDPPPAERVFTLDPGEGEGGIARSILDAHRAVEAVIGPAHPQPHPAGRRGGAMGKKGKLALAGEARDECERCLECATVCECCVDICPNRANVPIIVLTRSRPQILHLDGLCDGCGACGGGCPYESAPHRDKFTLFEREADFAAGENDGFVVLDFLARRVRLRLEGTCRDVCLREADPAVPGQIAEVMETVFTDYPYLLDTGRRRESDQVSLW